MKGDIVAGCQLIADAFGEGYAALEQLAVYADNDTTGLARRTQLRVGEQLAANADGDVAVKKVVERAIAEARIARWARLF